ncbi:MAG: alpha/beta fold hydrolase [Chloroflexota bacterium]
MPTININDVNLYYELHGSENAPVLVLNNGILMNAASSWAFQTKALSERYRLLQYDCRGQGQSDHPESPYSMELHADDLSALMDALKIETAHIAGISYGGEVAQAFVLKYPHKVRSLILMDTVSEVGAELRLVIQSWVDALRTGDALAFFNATVPWNFSPEWIAANAPLLEDAKKRYALLDFPAVIRLCEAFFDVNFTPRLGEIKAPTCIMVGELDLLKGIRYAEILKRNIPHAEVHVLIGAGHASCWERPQEFNSIVLGFLAKQLAN